MNYFHSVKEISLRHAGIFAAALVMAFLVNFPVVAFPFFAGSAYGGINIPGFGTDEHAYLVRAHKVLTQGNLANPYIADGKGQAQLSYSSAETIILAPFRLLGLDTIDVSILYPILDFIGVIAAMLAIYACVRMFSRDRLLATAVAVFVIGGYSIIYNKALFYTDYNIYERALFPVASAIPFFLYLLFSYRAVVERRSYYYAAGAALALGLMFYEYFYAWTFSLAFVGSLFLVSVVLRDWVAARVTLLIGACGTIVGAPVLVPILSFYSGASSRQLSYFNAVSHGRVPIMSLIGVATCALFVIYLYRHRGDPSIPFIGACILAGWVALEQQLITGTYLQYGHYYWYFIVPLSIVVGVYMLYVLMPRAWRVWFCALLIGLALVNTVGGQYRSLQSDMPDRLHEQEYAPAIGFLQKAPYTVVLSGLGGEPFTYLVNIYTNDDLYWAPGALLYNVSMDRVRESLFVYLYLNRDSRSDPAAYLESGLNAGTTTPYVNLYSQLEGYQSGLDYYDYQQAEDAKNPAILALREKLLAGIRTDYEAEFGSVTDFLALLKQRNVGYILWDTRLYPEWDFSHLPISLVASEGTVKLYKLTY